MINKFQKYLTPVFIISFILIYSTINVNMGYSSNNNAEQWINLTNSIFQLDNSKFYFSYGPLYWLTGGTVTPFNSFAYYISKIFSTSFYAIFWAGLFLAVIKFRVAILFAIGFIFFWKELALDKIFIIWSFFYIIYLDKVNKNEIKYFLVLASVVISVLFYVRFFYGMIGLMIISSWLLYSLYVKKIKIDIGWLFLIVTLFLYILNGLIIYKSSTSLVDYTVINLELSKANNIDMSLDVNYHIVSYLIPIAVIFITSIFCYYKAPFLLIPNIVLNIALIKLGFGRADHFLKYYIVCTSLYSFSLALIASKVGKYIFVLVNLLLLLLGISGAYDNSQIFKIDKPSIDFNKGYEQRVKEVYSNFIIDKALSERVGRASIDFFPNANEYAFANNLNYKQRPSFQSYMTLTPLLGEFNSNYLKNEGPKYLLWSPALNCQSPDCNVFDDIDGKYLLNEDPLTVQSILESYTPAGFFKNKNDFPLLLLSKNNTPPTLKIAYSTENKYKFNDWIQVPTIANNNVIKFIPHFKLTLIGKARNLFFNGRPIKIRYKFYDETIREYRLNIINSESGIWASPYLNSFDFVGSPVKEIMLFNNDNYINEEFYARWAEVYTPLIRVDNNKPVNIDFYLTDTNWVTGISRTQGLFFVPNSDYFKSKYIVGRHVIFQNSETRKINLVESHGQYLHVFVEGGLLNPKLSGPPYKFNVIK